MRKMKIPKELSHSGMQIKVWSKVWVKLLYLLTTPFPMFFLVDSLDYNLLSVSQLCKMGYNCLFTDVGVTVFRRSDDSIAFKGVLEPTSEILSSSHGVRPQYLHHPLLLPNPDYRATQQNKLHVVESPSHVVDPSGTDGGTTRWSQSNAGLDHRRQP
jgi:hypothetical protein